MKALRFSPMIGTTNDYSMLKWPLLLNSVLATVTALLLFLSFLSQTWFTFDLYEIDTGAGQPNPPIPMSYMLEQGSFGIRDLCIRRVNELSAACDTWTRLTRPGSFSVIFALLSIALFLSNLVLFPSWLSLIFVLYNISNRYVRYIVTLVWIVLFFTLSLVCVLTCVVILLGSSQFYSPGRFTIKTRHLVFSSGSGLYLIFSSTIFAIVCLTSVVMTLIGKQYIEMKLIEIEKELFRQLYDDNYRPSWDRIRKVPRPKRRRSKSTDQPPPYSSNYSDETDD